MARTVDGYPWTEEDGGFCSRERELVGGFGGDDRVS